MISGQLFQRKRSFKNKPKIHKITNYSIKRRWVPFHEKFGLHLNLTNSVGVHSRNIHTKFEANLCSSLDEDGKK